jgi:NADPH-dependent 2,4-dienoyl-CoA reductase/sulfur reductase-like enzyme
MSKKGKRNMHMQADVVIVGGSAAGLTAALTARRHYGDRSVLIIRREEEVLIPCGIPYVFGTVGSPQKNLIPDAVLEENDLGLSIDAVAEIDRAGKKLKTQDGDIVSYDRLVLATGSMPVELPIPGSGMDNIFTVQKSVAHLDRMRERLEEAAHLVIIGGGFIGVEFADECRKSSRAEVSVVEVLPRCLLAAFDEEFSSLAEDILRSRGINLVTNERVESFEGNAKVTGVRLASGKALKADVVLQSVGVRPNAELGRRAGLEIGPAGAIRVDRAMRTSDPCIFACGDCAEKVSFFTGEPSRLWLASIATTEARVAGANLYGITRAYPGAIGVYSTVIGETAFATAGLTEQAARDAGYCAVAGRSSAVNRHPGVMPEGQQLTLKLLFERQTRTLIGGQLMGAKSGGELINAVSACIQQRMTADQIATFQTGTHPALTASPIAYQLVNAAEEAIGAMDG